MSSPLTVRPDGSVALLPPQLFGTVAYYALMSQYPEAVIDTGMRYDKRFKSVHRYSIADTRGELRLTVPVSRPEGMFSTGRLTWKDVTVSSHGRWWEVHLQALESAYGRTPFFEYYIDRLVPLFTPDNRSICDLVLDGDRIIRAILGIDTLVSQEFCSTANIDDYRHIDFSKQPSPQTYWQIRADRYGFMPCMSVLDLIFNLGPEAPLALMCK